MSGASAVALAGLLVALFCVIVGVLVWQEAKRRPGSEPPSYVVEDAVRYITARLPDEVRVRIGVVGVRRVIQWEVHYLQGLAQPDRRNPVETVAGGSDASIDYIVSQIADVNDADYDARDVGEVLRLEADYLNSIGAIGEPVDLEQNDKGGVET